MLSMFQRANVLVKNEELAQELAMWRGQTDIMERQFRKGFRSGLATYNGNPHVGVGNPAYRAGWQQGRKVGACVLAPTVAPDAEQVAWDCFLNDRLAVVAE